MYKYHRQHLAAIITHTHTHIPVRAGWLRVMVEQSLAELITSCALDLQGMVNI